MQLGIQPILAGRKIHAPAGFEAIPESAFALLQQAGLETALARAGAELAQGFDNHWSDHSLTVQGRWMYVDRQALAHAAHEEARACGAELRDDFVREPAAFVIDATGRSAILSRPIEKRTREIATVFRLPRNDLERARVVRTPTHWAYAIPYRDQVDAGVVGGPVSRIPDEMGARLGLSGAAVFLARRPAFPQRSLCPIGPRTIAIGDAALAFSPLAGHGIQFAIQSAFAAAAVVRTWLVSPRDEEAARRYYQEFAAGAWMRHLAHLQHFERESTDLRTRLPVPSVVKFVGSTLSTGIQRDGRIAAEEAVRLPDGGLVRWVGGVDLLSVKALTLEPVAPHDLVARLKGLGLSAERGWFLVHWCIDCGVLA